MFGKISARFVLEREQKEQERGHQGVRMKVNKSRGEIVDSFDAFCALQKRRLKRQLDPRRSLARELKKRGGGEIIETVPHVVSGDDFDVEFKK